MEVRIDMIAHWRRKQELFVLAELTFTSLLLCGLPTAVTQTGHGLDVALTDRRRMKHQLGRAGQADRKSRRTHQNPCNAWEQPAEGVSELVSGSTEMSVKRWAACH